MSRSIYRIGQSVARPLSEVPRDTPPIVDALRYGISAPSPHNSQPWRIELVSSTEARLYFDPGRLLPQADPPGRQGHIGHGTLIEMTVIAATNLGYRCEVEILPDGEMSITEFGTKPTAVLRLVPEQGIAVDPLFSQILSRRASRLPHELRPITDEERQRIEAQARRSDVEIGWVSADRFAKVIDIVGKAMAVEVNDYEVFDETLHWFRFSDREIREKGDGLHLDTAGLSGLQLTLARMFTRPGTWHKSYNRGPYLSGFVASAKTTRAMLTLTTSTNTMRDWIATGRSYTRAELAANQLGLRFQPVSQALQEYPQMDALRAEMDEVMSVASPAKLQMLVRVGRTSQPGLSPRRKLDSIVQ